MPTPNVLILRSWALRKWLCLAGGVLVNGISVFIKALENFFTLSVLWGPKEKMYVCVFVCVYFPTSLCCSKFFFFLSFIYSSDLTMMYLGAVLWILTLIWRFLNLWLVDFCQFGKILVISSLNIAFVTSSFCFPVLGFQIHFLYAYVSTFLICAVCSFLYFPLLFPLYILIWIFSNNLFLKDFNFWK